MPNDEFISQNYLLTSTCDFASKIIMKCLNKTSVINVNELVFRVELP
jgi:hypothetical protein